jgi:phenylacetate-CoA ligase
LVININHPLEDYCQRLNECRPHNLTGYPFGIKVLAEMQRAGKIDISPEVVICGGEPLTAAARKFIKKTWDTSLINYYAASESLVIGVKKEEFNHLYIFDDANYIETAEEGYYLTNLYNYTQPLIRYRMSDLLVSVNEQKKEDRWPFNRVKEIIGRQEDILWFKNQAGKKEFIHPIIFVELYIRGLNKYQVIQTGETSFIFKAVIKKGSKNEDVIVKIKEELTKILKSKNLQNVNFRIKKVKNIDGAGTTGKFKLIKREFK